jgi:hypothetical protein
MAQGGKIWKYGENIPFFYPQLNFLQVLLSQVRKKLDQRGKISVVDPDPNPDPLDPRVFGPPGSGSGSISQRYGSGSF